MLESIEPVHLRRAHTNMDSDRISLYYYGAWVEPACNFYLSNLLLTAGNGVLGETLF